MSAKTVRLFAMSALLIAGTASAETIPSTESVTVMGSREAYHTFSRNFATPTQISGKMARWERHLCPVVVGQNEHYAAFITQHIKYVALAAGAPVAVEPSCKPNIEIVFTTSPQGLMDWVRQKHPDFLGYHDNSLQADRLASVTHPIQAWYTTATLDLRGNMQVDGARTSGPGMEIVYLCNPGTPGMICTMHLSDAHAASVTGMRLGDGQRSTLYHVLIIVDPTQLQDYGMGALSDYIAMLALTQVASLDACQKLSSIVNMLAKDCDQKSDALTSNDAAYLHALYRMSPQMNLGAQRDQVAYGMEQDLIGH